MLKDFDLSRLTARYDIYFITTNDIEKSGLFSMINLFHLYTNTPNVRCNIKRITDFMYMCTFVVT